MSELGMSFIMPSSFVSEKINGDSISWACSVPDGFFDLEVSAVKKAGSFYLDVWGDVFKENMAAQGYKASYLKVYDIPQACTAVGRGSCSNDVKDMTMYLFTRGEYIIGITITYPDKKKLTEESWNKVSAFLKTFSFSFIKIGLQTWMSKDLNVLTFRNGDAIPEAKTDKEWKQAEKNEQPAFKYRDTSDARTGKFAKLYNWYAVNDPRGLAPEGWHIPSLDEWRLLFKALGENSGIKLRSTMGWAGFASSPTHGTNESGFSADPFEYYGKWGSWWSTTNSNNPKTAYSITLFYDKVYPSIQEDPKNWGLHIRCIKD